MLHITKKHTGKMEGIQSLSTSCIANPICEKRRKCGESICSHCYAATLQKLRPTLRECLKRNYEELQNPIPIEQLPRINQDVFRLESFGDIASQTQFKNYINLCLKNSETRFTIWTKNPEIMKRVFDSGIKKPKNLEIIASSKNVNEIQDFSGYDFIDKVFTVFSKSYLKDHPEVVINCGGKHCRSCMLCYGNGNTREINEILK